MKHFSCLALCLALALLALPAEAKIRIAVAGPFSGSVAGLGEELRSGADAAVEDINNAGGVLKQELVLQYYDDACNATQASMVANKIVIDYPVAIIGHLCSAATLAASNSYNESGLPQITLSSNVQITESGYKHLFRIIGRDDNQARDLATYMEKSLTSHDVIAVIDDKGSWGLGFAQKLVEELKNKNLSTAFRDSINQGQKDFSALITRLKKEEVTTVALALYDMEASLLVRQAREQGYKGIFFGGDPLMTPQFWKVAGKAAEGMRISGPYDPRKTDEGKALMDRLTKANKPSGVYSYYAYAAVQAFAQAINNAGEWNSTSILKRLHEDTLNTIIGEISFDTRGDLKDFNYDIFIWHDGKLLQATNNQQ